MKTRDFPAALVSMADPQQARAVAAALRPLGWKVTVAAPSRALRSLASGGRAVALIECGPAQAGWAGHLDAAARLPAPPRVLALVAPADAYRLLDPVTAPHAYALAPADAAALASRLHALGRAGAAAAAQHLVFEAGMVLDAQTRRVIRPGLVSQLTPREFELLRLLLSRRGQVVTRDETAQHLYRWGEDIGSNTVDVHIHALRRRLAPLPIRTVRGAGYVFV